MIESRRQSIGSLVFVATLAASCGLQLLINVEANLLPVATTTADQVHHHRAPAVGKLVGLGGGGGSGNVDYYNNRLARSPANETQVVAPKLQELQLGSLNGTAVVKNKNNNKQNKQHKHRYSDKKRLISECLDAHNKLRRLHGVPNLKWDPKIAEFAQLRSDYIADSDGDKFEHPPNLPYGENLFWHSSSSTTCAKMVEGWYNEIKLYNYKRPGFDHDTGHFTQVVWRSTKRVGCATAVSTGPKGGVFLTCNYDPAGNYLGEFPANVPRPGSKPSKVPRVTTPTAPRTSGTTYAQSTSPSALITPTTTTTTAAPTTTTTTTTTPTTTTTTTTTTKRPELRDAATTKPKKKSKKKSNKKNKNKKNKNKNKRKQTMTTTTSTIKPQLGNLRSSDLEPTQFNYTTGSPPPPSSTTTTTTSVAPAGRQ